MTDNTLVHSKATITTDKASRYLQQLCKHFGHKIEVAFDPNNGKIIFPFGECHLEANEAELRLSLQSPTAEQLEQLQGVVERHLVRFAFREELQLNWQAA